MLQTKFGGNRSTGSGEDFEPFLPFMGMVAIFIDQVVSEKKMFKQYGRQQWTTTDG